MKIDIAPLFQRIKLIFGNSHKVGEMEILKPSRPIYLYAMMMNFLKVIYLEADE
jgi:hypothetical protein